jgi:exodeoxyribonuclease-3
MSHECGGITPLWLETLSKMHDSRDAGGSGWAPAAVVTWNVNGLRARWAEIEALVKTYCPDVLCLQETKHKLGIPRIPWFWQIESPFPVSGRHGVAMYVKEALIPVGVAIDPDLAGHLVAADLSNGARVACLYTKNSGNSRATLGESDAFRRRFDDRLWMELERLRSGCPTGVLVVAGDLNVCIDRGDHYTGKTDPSSAGRKPYEIARAREGMAEVGLRDVYMDLNPDHAGERWTFWSRRFGDMRTPRPGFPHGCGWRLDYVLAKGANFRAAEVLSTWGSSDHMPVAVW